MTQKLTGRDVPKTLNGYTVIRASSSKRGDDVMNVMVHRKNHTEPYVVVTWWPELGTTWMWGHYFHDKEEASKLFNRRMSGSWGYTNLDALV